MLVNYANLCPSLVLEQLLVADITRSSPVLCSLQPLTHLSVDAGHAFDKNCGHLWDRIWDALQELQPFNNLQYLTISLRYLRLGTLKRLSDPTGRGWRLLHQLLGPELAPSLQKVHVSVFWMYDPDGERGEPDFDVIDFTNQRISEVIGRLIERCLPKWEGDTRRIHISSSLEESEV